MKKIYPLLLCLLSFVAAKAQTGNVGINTPTPNATLDVQATSDNTTDNLEGILIPRVSKAKAYNMANGTNTLDESTMIYVNDTISTDFASGMAEEIAKVEEINENGFYFWNGDKWVKTAGSEGTPWLKDEDGNIVLNNPDSRDSVSYSKEGRSSFISKESFSSPDNVFFNPSTGAYLSGVTLPTNYHYRLSQESQNIFPDDITSPLKQFAITSLAIGPGDTNDDKSFYTDISGTGTTASNDKNYKTIITKRNLIGHTGSGIATTLRTVFNTAIVAPNSTAVNTEVGYDLIENFSDSLSSKNIVHTNRLNAKGSGEIDWLILNRNYADLKHSSSSDINVFKMAEDRLEVDDDYTGTIDRLWGNHIFFRNNGSSTPNVNKVYGLNISNVDWGTEENYAIFTSLGKVSFGDSLQLRNVNATESTSTTDKIIVADADGVLKTTSQSVAALGSKWSNIAADGATPLTNLADGTTARPDRKSVTFFDSGSLRLGFDDSFDNVDVEGNPIDPINSDSEADKGITVNLYDGSGVIGIDGKNYVNEDSTSFAMIQATDNRAAILSVANTTSQQQWNISATSGNNGLAIQETTNGTTAMFMDDSGNVAINNFDPQQKLDVGGNIRVRALPNTDGLITDRLLVTSSLGTVKSLPQEDAREILSKWNNDTAKNAVHLTNLSDGTTARPDRKTVSVFDGGSLRLGFDDSFDDLDIEGNPVVPNPNADKSIKVNLYEGSGSISIDGRNTPSSSTTDYALIQAVDNRAAILSVANSTLKQQWNISATTGNNGLAIQETTNGTTAMFMDDSGNVGINNFDPQQKLDISGNIRVRTLPLTDGLITERLLVTSSLGTVKSLPQDDARAILSKWTNDDTNAYINISKLSNGTTDRIESNNMFLMDSGRVGIGTNSPDEKLEVDGNVKANTFIAGSGATFPDYVFEKYYQGESKLKSDYQFKSLAEVEDFAKQNGHLPGYKSAKEIATEGQIDITATQLTNVEKIEELYLHTIEQEKKIKEKDAQIEDLESRIARLEKLLLKKD